METIQTILEVCKFSKLAPIVKNHAFLPFDRCCIQSLTESWSRSFKAMSINGLLASFEQIVQKFNNSRSHFFKYLQICSFISSNITQFTSQPPDTLPINDITSSRKGKIGDIYSLLKRKIWSLNSLKGEWEGDLGIDISESILVKDDGGIYSFSICMKHAVMQFKIFHQLNWANVKPSQFTSNIDPMCDHCKQNQANYN